MDSQKLVRRLAREIRENPKKATLLGLLVVVVTWSWAPMLMESMTPRDSAPEARQVGNVEAMATDSSSNGGSDKPSLVATPTWERVVRWMQDDPRTRVVSRLPGNTNPFHEEDTQQTDAEKGQKAATAPPNVVDVPADPQSLGLVISSTIIGPRRRAAMVNGKAYTEGGTVVVSLNDRPIEFQLVKVQPRGVVLEREGKSFEVNLPEPKPSGRMEIELVR